MSDAAHARHEAVIGLEIHVQLRTRTKLFCGDTVAFGGAPNTRVCPVCLGLPGALPVVNALAVELAVRTALGLGCTVHETSRFARKHYFYPDLPKGYQITQHDEPIATGGSLDIRRPGERRIRIRRVHLEEDAGRSLHDRFDGCTAVDLNRAGVPLVEIVTEPDLRSPAEARAFLDRLKQTLQYLDVSDCDMEKGSLRVDANISIRASGGASSGARTELKNLNSFSSVERALEWETARQARAVGKGGVVEPETLLWDADRGEARSMRSKESGSDYRYFPEPDVPPVSLSADLIASIAAALPEMPAAKESRLRASYGLPAGDASVLSADRHLADWFEAVAQQTGDGKASSNWVLTHVLGWLNQRGLSINEIPFTPARLAELIGLVLDGTISVTAGRSVFREMAESGKNARDIVAARGLAQVRDDEQIEVWVDTVVARYPDEVMRYRAGAAQVFGFLMGRLMKESAGTADPRRASELLRRRLDE
ncbi:MAG TPA: Asp-tRNA(Asn)/Glu-tRNA(Gln) amidotransferase subunit GatB [Longimicrobiales bacterium]|nr:Asp-tRNA(Asn)/Glu-tRNA(Gln) amidotransferase subunit GatB [Longimicrobiales bacterium]